MLLAAYDDHGGKGNMASHVVSRGRCEIDSVEGYKMIKSLTIENFRCFKKIELHGLGTINLLVGQNGSGKTAFLEALYLLIGSGPRLALMIRGWRGLGNVQVGSDRASFEEMWADLFYHFGHQSPILINEIDSNRRMRSLTIAYKADENYVLPLGESAEDTLPVPLDFEYRIDGREPEHAKAAFTSGGISIGGIKETVPGVFFGAGGQHGPNTVKRFSDLVKENKESIALSAIQDEFPQIEGLTVAEHLGQPILFATVEGIPERKLPMELVSMGIHKYFGLLLSIMASPKGVVLADEIDNGLHHSKLVRVWKHFLELAKINRTQIIASTHSGECIAALAEALKDDPDELGIIHLKRVNGESTAVRFSGKDALCALDQGFDVR